MTDIFTRLTSIREHSRTAELREHIRRGYDFTAQGNSRKWILQDDEIHAINVGFEALECQRQSLIALVREAAAELEQMRKWRDLALAIGKRETERLQR